MYSDWEEARRVVCGVRTPCPYDAYPLTLFYGANDLGSLMMEESVVPAAGVSHPLTCSDLDEMIIGAGFKPTLRDNGYNISG